MSKRGAYGDDEDSPPTPSDEESDFDDDEDPDNLEVPGGGKTLAAAARLADKKPNPTPMVTVKPTTNPLAAPSGVAFGQVANMKPIKIQASQLTKPISLGAGRGVVAAAGAGAGAAPSLAAGSSVYSAASLLAQMEMVGNMPGMNSYLLQNLNQILASGMGGPLAGMLGQLAQLPPWSHPKGTMWQPDKMPAEEEEVDDEDMGVAETYADYMPLKLKLGRKHPDPVVETASLSSVEPAEVTYELALPGDTVRGGLLSALQLEAIVYASQAHQHLLPDGTRAGFLIGDGAGVGKGRTIAGIIFENYVRGRRRAVWVSVSNDLKYDAERDLRDVGAGHIAVYPLNKFKYAKISSAVNGNVKKGVVFATYSALIGETQSSTTKYRSRLKQLLQWCGEDFDGLIVFDECHKAKNLCPVGSGKATKTGLTALELQTRLPKARVVYASATGASEPRNMAYMVRLGIWGDGTPFPTFMDFINAVEKRGVGAMEIVAMDMKLRGMYIARQLSFHGVSFKIEEVPLSDAFKETYDKAVALWVEAMQRFTEAAELIDAEPRMKKTMWGQFWSAHQRFFKYLCIAAKVNHAVVTAREAVKCGKCVVIGLQSTGEARTLDQLERDDGELTDFVSTAKGVFQTLVEKHFPAPDRNRINRLLGLEPAKAKGKAAPPAAPAAAAAAAAHYNPNGLDGDANTSKRKLTSRQQANQAAKRARGGSSSDEFVRGSEDELELDADADRDSDDARRTDSDLSDFNPFRAGSDSDDDPWIGRKKKITKKKKAPAQKKKPASTQDKIETMFERKNSAPAAAPVTVAAPGGLITGTPVGTNGLYLGPSRSQPPPRSAIERACSMKEELLAAIERLGRRLPPNTLDQLVDELGGTDNVAEMTGRKGRVVQTEDGQILYESRSEADVPLETLNLTEKQRFMDGEKDVAIISEAASSGISLQSDRRARNQRRRVHITLELPWSADRAIQQFGRTHRSNQVNAPEYIFLISDLAGERRFASTVAKRLESLGALTHGDRRATETRDLSQFNIDNKYGRAALEAVMKAIMKYESPLVAAPRDYAGDFFQDVASALVGVGLIVNSEAAPGVLSLDKDYNNMSKFLNRILGMPVDLQNRLFKYFTDTLTAVMEQAKRSGRFDLGILDLGSAGELVRRVRCVRFVRRHATGRAPVELHTVHSERGMEWMEALEKCSSATGPKDGFYLSQAARNNKYTAVLCLAAHTNPHKKEKLSKKEQMFQLYRPNTGLQLRLESLAEIEKKYKKVESSEAESWWRGQYSASLRVCSHAYWRGACRGAAECEVGLRRRTYHVLAGSVLAVWARVEAVLAARSALNKMQVVRIKTDRGLKIVGTMIPKNCVDPLKETLSSDAVSVTEQNFEQPDTLK
ncbi:protein strawberry notch-like isoform X4 [Galleria mellonella]|uniref:Protein strawberry notch-like isoform X4 n=1 Tax=Galleria mellonella TaxID=7137 RepID=A0ABM3N2F0_GALME|nr:protein strawberry notch-like isoform X4 [Galleria mellonella]